MTHKETNVPESGKLLKQEALCVEEYALFSSSSVAWWQLARGVGLSEPPEQKKPAKHRPFTNICWVSIVDVMDDAVYQQVPDRQS